MSTRLSIFIRIAPLEPRKIIGFVPIKNSALHRLVASLAAIMASVNRIRDDPLLPC
jgi:hypothetical protein